MVLCHMLDLLMLQFNNCFILSCFYFIIMLTNYNYVPSVFFNIPMQLVILLDILYSV